MTESSLTADANIGSQPPPAEIPRNEAWVQDLSQRLKEHNGWTFEHSQIVSKTAEKLGIILGLNEEKIRLLRIAGLLHDVGKIFVPLDILDNSSPKLMPQQRKIIMQHPRDGFEIVRQFDLDVAKIIASHHEVLNDNPYPREHQRDENDPLKDLKLMVALSDSVDAAISKRPYKPALSAGMVFEKLSQTGVDNKLLQLTIDVRLGLNPAETKPVHNLPV